MLAIAESTPGTIAVNSATFVGYRVAGFLGALFATIGVVLPSFLVILLLAGVLEQFKELKYVSYAFEGVRAGVAVLIINAVFKLSKQCPKNVFAIVVAAAAFILVGTVQPERDCCDYMRCGCRDCLSALAKAERGRGAVILLHLFLTFFKIGLFTIGGGYAMIPLIQEEVLQNHWLSSTDLIDLLR